MAIKIAVDSGHGLDTQGKMTPPLKSDLYFNSKLVKKKGQIIHEKEFNMASANYLITALKRCGFEVLNVSPGTKDISLMKRVRAANNWGADFYISKHYNAVGNCKSFQNKISGIVTIYHKGSARSKKAATIIQDELIKAHGGYSFGAKADVEISGFSLYVLRNTTMTAVLTESGFMDNEKEAKRMLDPKFQKTDAEATCKGICRYFGVKYVAEKKDSKKMVKNISNEKINIRNSANWQGNIVGELSPGDSLTYIAGPLTVKNGSTKMYKCKNEVYITASPKYVEIVEI